MQKKKRLIVMIGIAGSGKSTWIESHKDTIEGPHRVVSRDAIRFSLVNENEKYFSKEKEVFKQYIKEIKEGLDNNETVIADATHLNKPSRRKLFYSLGESLMHCEIIGVVIRTSLDTAIERNNMRSGRKKVPENVIRDMNKHFTIPNEEEGFDTVILTPIDQKPGDYVIRMKSTKAVIA